MEKEKDFNLKDFLEEENVGAFNEVEFNALVDVYNSLPESFIADLRNRIKKAEDRGLFNNREEAIHFFEFFGLGLSITWAYLAMDD